MMLITCHSVCLETGPGILPVTISSRWCLLPTYSSGSSSDSSPSILMPEQHILVLRMEDKRVQTGKK